MLEQILPNRYTLRGSVQVMPVGRNPAPGGLRMSTEYSWWARR